MSSVSQRRKPLLPRLDRPPDFALLDAAAKRHGQQVVCPRRFLPPQLGRRGKFEERLLSYGRTSNHRGDLRSIQNWPPLVDRCLASHIEPELQTRIWTSRGWPENGRK
jgi:hypothetical protein